MFKLLQIEYEEHPLYHRTKAVIESLDEKFLQYETDWHNNGAIGLWCSTYPRLCSNFGQNCYEIKLKPDTKRYGMSLEDLKKLSDERPLRQSYSDLRKYCLDNKFDVLYIKDRWDLVGEVIIINYDQVESISLVEPPEDKEYKLFEVENE